MLIESILSTSDTTEGIDLKSALICTLVALLMGIVISIIYLVSNKKKDISSNMAISLVLLPGIVAVVIMLIGSNVARAFSMAGAFALVRFRSVPGDSKDIATVFYAMSAGLAAGLGYVWFAVIFTFIIGIIYFILNVTDFGMVKTNEKVLRVTIPENLNYNGAFDDLFEKFSDKNELTKVKTTNMGSLFELTYNIELKDDVDEKEFIDELRCRNGNLNIILCKAQTFEAQL